MPKNPKSKQRSYDKKRAGMRSRNWLAVIYPDDLPADYVDILSQTGINAVLSPIHDKDVNADGSPKKVHRHLVLTFDSVKTSAQVYDFFGELFGKQVSENSDKTSVIGVAMPQRCANKVGAVRYLTHMDNPEKAQYDKADIICLGGANVDEMLKASPDETFVLQATVESIIEEAGFTEYAVVARYLRDTDFELYKTFTTHTLHFNAFIRSRRHMAN